MSAYPKRRNALHAIEFRLTHVGRLLIVPICKVAPHFPPPPPPSSNRCRRFSSAVAYALCFPPPSFAQPNPSSFSTNLPSHPSACAFISTHPLCPFCNLSTALLAPYPPHRFVTSLLVAPSTSALALTPSCHNHCIFPSKEHLAISSPFLFFSQVRHLGPFQTTPCHNPFALLCTKSPRPSYLHPSDSPPATTLPS